MCGTVISGRTTDRHKRLSIANERFERIEVQSMAISMHLESRRRVAVVGSLSNVNFGSIGISENMKLKTDDEYLIIGNHLGLTESIKSKLLCNVLCRCVMIVTVFECENYAFGVRCLSSDKPNVIGN